MIADARMGLSPIEIIKPSHELGNIKFFPQETVQTIIENSDDLNNLERRNSEGQFFIIISIIKFSNFYFVIFFFLSGS